MSTSTAAARRGRRRPRTATIAAAAALALSLGLCGTAVQTASAASSPGPAASTDPAAADSAPADSAGVSTVTEGHAAFDLSGKVPGLTVAGTGGAATVGDGSGVRMWVTRGSLDHADRRFTGGKAVLSGGFRLRMGDGTTKIDHLTLDLADGELRARIDGSRMLLGTMNTRRLHVSSSAGQQRVYFSVRSDLRLSAVAAARLNTALNTGVFASGDVLASADIALGVPLDRRLASDLGIGYQTAMDANIQADIQRDAPTDLGLGLF